MATAVARWKLTLMFGGLALAGSSLWTVIDIFAFGRVEGAIGDRWDNLQLTVLVSFAVAALLALGCQVALAVSRRSTLLLPRPVVLSAVAAAGSWAGLYLFGQTARFWSPLFESWRVNIATFALFCVLLGAVVGRVLVRLSRQTRSAA